MDNIKPIDIFITCYLRPEYTRKTLQYLKDRTNYPFRLFVINNGGNDEVLKEFEEMIFLVINPSHNIGVTAAWQIALSLAQSDYFITSDNDIYVPNLQPDWLAQMVEFMNDRLDFGAISLHPHVLIGDASFDPDDSEDVKQVPWCGAVMRIMRRDAVWQAGGWAKEPDTDLIRSDRGHEERTIGGRLNAIGFKCGRTTRIRAFHPFGKDIPNTSGWGYPPEFPPEKQGHRPEMAEEVKRFDNPEAFDNNTWLPKS